MNSDYPIEIFQTEDGRIRLEVQLKEETVWLTQKQMGRLFGRERSVITKHINNIFKEDELARDSVSANFAHTAEDGKTYRTRYFNLDVIISVGYRVKSKRGVQFRQWATRVLKEHPVKGCWIPAFAGMTAERRMAGIVIPAKAGIQIFVLWLLRSYTYSDSNQRPIRAIRRPIELDRESNMQKMHIAGSAERVAFHNPHQTFDVHLRYFIIKNHHFADGNKRIGCFLFLLYLKAHGLNRTAGGRLQFAANALVALALLTAESDPGQKELMIRLVQHLIGEGG